jgi:hypothetical protein
LPELHRSARKHYHRDRLNDDAVRQAASHVLASWPLDDEDDPRRWLLMGMDSAGRTLELVTLTFDDGHEMIIHAMIARPEYLRDL